MDQERPTRMVFFISDSTGITAEALGRSLLAQFENIDFKPIFLPFIHTPEQARRAVAKIDAVVEETGLRPLIFDTVVKPEVREVIDGSRGMVLDFLRTFVGPLEEELGVKSTYSVGRVHKIDSHGVYDRRIDAVNFALSHDDGLSAKSYHEAELILIGVSRCGKTPTSLYMALQFGIKVANYPFTSDDMDHLRLTPELEAHRKRLYGLTIDPRRLHEIRTERRAGSSYASLPQCRFEIRQVEALFARENVHYVDTTRFSVEEIAAKILSRTRIERHIG